ncbi:acyl-CoA/acyl-ACP dehydrogenase [Dactylosporangium roseum]|uniref:Acyl-CoA/acyl-ACP dehydrogenase n=1 Tax=Dactylosporangium roseum TaxID=47989 RepID=A0ABY5ZBY8_9ACTN|nr:acyl-CoA dehydrogenase family protein [Dactylosporangium roseum]UWZ39579.1 acyl-CoA/acyl-ACP dehydrogenase [Dactylosporangium roseum]
MSPLTDVLAVVAEHARRTDDEAAFPVEALEALRGSGLLGLMVPAADGGGGGSLADLVDVTARIARVDLSAAMVFAMHCQQVLTIVRYATGPLRDELLPALGRGELYLASVTTERGKGGHLLASESPVETGGNQLHLDRDAPIVTGGTHADGFLITTLAPKATSPHQVSLVYAWRDQLKVETHGSWNPLGMRATHSLPMRLIGSVPTHHVVGPEGGFRGMVAECFGPVAHLGWAACWLGTAAGALSRVLRFMRSADGRRRFNTQSELLLVRLARVRGELDAVHALLSHTVAALDTAPDVTAAPVQLLVNTLKVQAAERCFGAVNELVELVGLQHGYLRDSPLFLERALRDLRSATLNYGNDRLNLVNGALALLDQEVRLG